MADREPPTFPSENATVHEWALFLDEVHHTWGDGWLLRRTVCTAGAARDLTTVVTLLKDSAGSPLKNLVETQIHGWEHLRGAHWWNEQLASASDVLSQRIWVLMLLTIPYVEVVKALASELDDVVGNLSDIHYRALAVALSDLKQRARARGLLVDDEVRRGSVAVSSRTLWLLHLAAPAGSTRHIDARIASDPAQAARLGPDALGVALQGLASGRRKLPYTDFVGTHRHFPAGSFTGDRLRIMTQKQAQEVLLSPAEWPSDVVEVAFHQAMSSLPGREPLARVSEAWNMGPSTASSAHVGGK